MLEPIVRLAIAEDLGVAGDVTTDALIEPDTRGAWKLVARKAGVVAGLDAAGLAAWITDPDILLKVRAQDGAHVGAGETIAELEGYARSVLRAERVMLNFVGQLSGVATLTRAYVDAVAGTNAKIACTRKTTPGLRALEKRAVRLGGGLPHRYGLSDAILIKDNHIAAAGGVAPALQRAKAAVGHLMPIEIEVDSLAQLEEALAFAPTAILLDNFTLENLREAVKRVDGKIPLEASGGVSLETVRAIAETGVDVISVGALTHSAPALDVALDTI
ncbi:MAG TPA: carboxylating nicotinate-nucleotide diphosphorylase [Caulobacterales bacterium]|nr:carboxylating nicotinate-nucleotide diphosphorylase [Caulobacterales bacterium]